MNKVILCGNLGSKPELKYSASGTAVCIMSLATSKKYKNDEGEKKETVQWHRLVSFARLAEVCAEYLNKGSQVLVSGELVYNKFQDSDGNNRWSTEIIISEMKMLDKKQ